MRIILSPFLDQHISFLEQLLEEILSPAMINQLQGLENTGGLLKIILSDGEPIGVVSIIEEEIFIAVVASFQRKGVATATINQVILLAKEKNISKIKAKTMIGKLGDKLAQKLNAKEISRSNTEIFYEIAI